MMKYAYIAIVAIASSCILSGCGCSRDRTEASDGAVERMNDAAYRKDLGSNVAARNSLLEKRAAIAKRAEAGEPAAKKELENIDKELDAVQKQAQDAVRARILEGAAKKGSLKK
jgi:hypothetical protein